MVTLSLFGFIIMSYAKIIYIYFTLVTVLPYQLNILQSTYSLTEHLQQQSDVSCCCFCFLGSIKLAPKVSDHLRYLIIMVFFDHIIMSMTQSRSFTQKISVTAYNLLPFISYDNFHKPLFILLEMSLNLNFVEFLIKMFTEEIQ